MSQYDDIVNRTRDLEQQYARCMCRKYHDLMKRVEMTGKRELESVSMLKTQQMKIEVLENENRRLLEQLKNERSTPLESVANVVERKCSELSNQLLEFRKLYEGSERTREEEMGGLIERVTRLEKGGGNIGMYQKRVRDLEASIEELRRNEEVYRENVHTVEKQKDKILLLERLVEEKDNVIMEQRKEIDVFRSKPKNPFEDDMIITPQKLSLPKEEDETHVRPKEIKRGKSRQRRNAAPAPNIPPVLGGGTDKRPSGVKAAESIDTKKVKTSAIEALIKKDNASFFANLSFANSSPAPDKRKKG